MLRAVPVYCGSGLASVYGSERYGIFCGISQWEGMGLEYGMGLEDLSSHIFLQVWDRDLVGYPNGMGYQWDHSVVWDIYRISQWRIR